MTERNQSAGMRLRVIVAPGVSIGPGKAALLEGIAETGSIAAAGQRLDMSYKRAWNLVRRMNDAYGAPVVTTARGGAARGGATLTTLGETVLATYRRLESRALAAIEPDMAALRALLPDTES